MSEECSICNGKADEMFKRFEVWESDLWRLTMSRYRAVEGFCYLEPKRHIQYITELDGKEALEFGSILAKVSNALKKATGAKLVYVYIYGDHIPHLHVHLAPHKEGDIFVNDVVKSDKKIGESILGVEEFSSLAREVRADLAMSAT